MPIDSNIALGFKPSAELQDPMNSLAKFMQIQGLQQQGDLHRMQADEYRTGVERKNKLYGLMGQDYADDGAREAALLRGGFSDEALKLGTARRANATADVAKRKADLENHLKTFEISGQIMSAVRDQASWDAARVQTEQLLGPEVAARLPAQYDPAAVKANMLKAVSVKDQMQQEHQALTAAETARHNKAGEGIQYAQLGETRRHHGATEGQARDAAAATMSKPFEVTGPEGTPILVQQDKKGNITRVEGFSPKAGAGGAGTGDERNAAGYASRMGAAEKLIADAIGKDPKAQKPGLVEQLATGSGMDMAANGVRSAVRQEYRQAQEDWVRAKLRKESGAAIPNDEMEREISVYFPQINDKPGVIAQKAAARKVAEKAMQQSAGRAYKAPAPDAEAPTPSAPVELPVGWKVTVR